MKITKTQLKEHIRKIVREQSRRSKPNDLEHWWQTETGEDYWKSDDLHDPDSYTHGVDPHDLEDERWDTELYPKGKIKEHIRKVVREYLNEQWNTDSSWGSDERYSDDERGGDDEYPRRRRGGRESDADRNARLDYEDQKRLGLDENLAEGWDEDDYYDRGGDMGRGGSDEDHYGDALDQQRKAERQVSLWRDILNKATTPEEQEKAKKEIAGWGRKADEARRAARSLKADAGRWRGHR